MSLGRLLALGRVTLWLAAVGLGLALLGLFVPPRPTAGSDLLAEVATFAALLLFVAMLVRLLLATLVAVRDRFDRAMAALVAGGETVIALTDGRGRAVVPVRREMASDALTRAGPDDPSRPPDGSLIAHAIGPDRVLWTRHACTSGREASAAPAPQAVLRCDRSGRVLQVSDGFRAWWGSSPDRLQNMPIAPASGAMGIADWARATTTPTARLFQAYPGHPSGPRPVAVQVWPIGGDLNLVFVPLEGAAPQSAAGSGGHPAPAAQTAGCDDDVEHIPIPLLRFDPTGALLRANRAGREAVGLTPNDHPPAHMIFDGLGRPVADWIADVGAMRLPTSTEILRLSCDPTQPERFFQITLRRADEGGHITVLAVLQDATAFKSLEAQFVQSQKMQAIGQLAGGIAHDFNNLLTAISGHCDLLMLRHRYEDPAYADLVQIHQNANRAAALVGQLLAFSRKQTLKPERLDLEEVLSDLTHLLNRLVGEKMQLRLYHAHGLGQIRADRRKLEQVILNLVVNARDAMPDGGTILLRTEGIDLGADMFRDRVVVPKGRYAAIRVIDQGVGIPPERLQKIFEPFFTTKRAGEGTGLGLSTAYGIVKQSGGFIFVQSTPGFGSQFEVLFPIHDGPEEKAAPAAPPVARTRPGEGVVLLVEDEAPVRAFAARALRLRGYTVLEADCGETALALLEDHSLHVDLFVTDVIMPGLDGPGWVAQALTRRPDVPTVFMSGYAEDGLSESQGRIAQSVFLPKPFSLTDLTLTVQTVLGQTVQAQGVAPAPMADNHA